MVHFDQITLDRIQKLHPKIRVDAACLYGKVAQALTGRAFCRFDLTLRTFAEQDALFAQGRTKPGAIVTNARGGQSYHNYGLAFDFFLVVDTDGNGSYDTAKWDMKTDFDGDNKADWMEVVDIAKAAGWEWGGDWHSIKDYPHLQKTFGISWQQLLVLHQAGKVDKEGYVLI